ncbi:MlaD protein [Desulfocicer vacuolatum DSM 3385]|uniref:MlaD protein n=1 Tax=Desulfocicer vacuolatum DSM 3385 TaxID=1121400 RepID=A0A1W2A532_9BACT|nr:MlaD family protein [Desulfocicer vacuolatum]SMC55531.1 MlaD protein [Desulfocicer vacuolatum DSM 3385]
MYTRLKLYLTLFGTLFLFMGCADFSLDLSFSDIQGLKKEAPIFFDQNKVGHVTHIAYTDGGEFIVSVDIDDAFKSAFTEHSRFSIVDSPLQENEKAIIMTLAHKGGEPLKKGAVIKAVPPSPLQGLTPFMDKLKSGMDKMVNNMKSIPESKEYQDLEKRIDELAQKMKTSGEAFQESIKNDFIPKLKKEIEALGKALEEKGMKDETKPLEKKLNALEDV